VAATAAKKNSDEVSELYRQGLASALDAQAASVQLFEAEVSRVRSRYELQRAQLDLRAAVGLDPLGNVEERR
jgi:outer membrane protein TolC